jgi:hypothetical protein
MSSALGHLLAKSKQVERRPKVVRKDPIESKESDVRQDIIDELVAGRAQRHEERRPHMTRRNGASGLMTNSKGRVLYVLGERPEKDKAVPSAKKGCMKKLGRRELCEKSRRRLDSTTCPASYNHYKEYVEEVVDNGARSSGDRGPEVFSELGSGGLNWEGMGTMHQ